MLFFHEVVICPDIARRYNASQRRNLRDSYPMATRSLRTPLPLLLCLGVLHTLPSASALAGVASPWAEGHNSRARLIAGDGVAGVELQLPEGWKTYWRNPGDAGGVPPSFDWSQSGNLANVQVLYPAPKRFTDRSGDTVGYKGTVVFPLRLTPKDPAKPIDLRLTMDYGVCKEICIPGEAALELAVAPEKGSGIPAEIADALARVPAADNERRPDDPILKDVHSELGGTKPRLVLNAEFPGGADHADIFIEAPPGLYVPLPKKIADDGNGHATFEVDLSDGIDLKDLKDQKLTATLTSDKGQSETTFSVD
jgi:DsbC/DsbD-like thiol-disulfide interchange protein